MRDLETNETLIVGVMILVRRNIKVHEKFKCIFRGKTLIERGRYSWWYPVKNTAYARLVNELKNDYGMKVEYGVMGTMEI